VKEPESFTASIFPSVVSLAILISGPRTAFFGEVAARAQQKVT
jgi:hypothetical protein